MSTEIQITPLDREARTALSTREAAVHLNKAPQTLRLWSCRDTGRIRPIRIAGTKGLLWPTAELRRLLACGGAP